MSKSPRASPLRFFNGEKKRPVSYLLDKRGELRITDDFLRMAINSGEDIKLEALWLLYGA